MLADNSLPANPWLVLYAVVLSIPPTIAAITAYRKINHRLGKPGTTERQRLNGRKGQARRLEDSGLSINTTLGIIHADVVDARDDISEVRGKLTSHIDDSARDRADLRGQVEWMSGQVEQLSSQGRSARRRPAKKLSRPSASPGKTKGRSGARRGRSQPPPVRPARRGSRPS